jgi:hypothetical protein
VPRRRWAAAFSNLLGLGRSEPVDGASTMQLVGFVTLLTALNLTMGHADAQISDGIVGRTA